MKFVYKDATHNPSPYFVKIVDTIQNFVVKMQLDKSLNLSRKKRRFEDSEDMLRILDGTRK